MEYYRPPQDESRFYAWVNATHWLDEIEPDLLKSWVQGMAHLDAQLWLREDLAHQGRITGEIVHELSDRQTLSNLWVLGMYELLRTLKGLRDHPVSDDRGKKVNRGFEVTEHALELLRPNSSRLDQAEEHCRRIRIVLAKMEVPWKYPGDTGLAIPAVSIENGSIAWKIDPTDNDYVSRRAVASEALASLQEAQARATDAHA